MMTYNSPLERYSAGKTAAVRFNTSWRLYERLQKQADLTLDIEKGDVLLGGRFKNIPMTVEEFGTDENGQPTVNGRKLLSYRIKKLMPKTAADTERVRVVAPTGRGSYLMEELLYPPKAGKVRFPGGKLEKGEDYTAAAVRELAEETGQVLDPAVLEYLGQEGDEHLLLAPRGTLAAGEFNDLANPGRVIPLRPHRMTNRNYIGVNREVLRRLLQQRGKAVSKETATESASEQAKLAAAVADCVMRIQAQPPRRQVSEQAKLASAIADCVVRIQLKMAGAEREPVVDNHESAPADKMRPRSELVLFTREGVYAIDKGDYILFPGGGVDDGEQPRDAAIRETLEEANRHPINITASGVVEAVWPTDSGNSFWDSSDFDGERTYFFSGLDAGEAGVTHADQEPFAVIPFDELTKRLDELIADPAQAWAKRNNQERKRLVTDARRAVKFKSNMQPTKQAADQAIPTPQPANLDVASAPAGQPAPVAATSAQQQPVPLPTDMQRQAGDPDIRARDFVGQLKQQQQSQVAPNPATPAPTVQNAPVAPPQLPKMGSDSNSRMERQNEGVATEGVDAIEAAVDAGDLTDTTAEAELLDQVAEQAEKTAQTQIEGDGQIPGEQELVQGAKEEAEEHGGGIEEGAETAGEHLEEDRNYYEKLQNAGLMPEMEKKADAAQLLPTQQHILLTPEGQLVMRRLANRRFNLPNSGAGRRAPYERSVSFIPPTGIPDEGFHGYNVDLHVGETDEVPEGYETIDPKKALTELYASMGLPDNRPYRDLDRARARTLLRLLKQRKLAGA